ncbi:hypothetical protein [Caldalkalibacillus salinus]|uniref:hypothetical protein n=1 Tax=Caldalkalibacillus salinus TaxID=2803787 RepID=UPI0019243DE3|nr:hypothetical protein [Caldalkalibacillus salinus]
MINRRVLVTIFLLSLFTGCNQQNDKSNGFFVFAKNENMNNELRESLFKCLNTEEIEYKVDKDKNVIIQKKDSELAVARCS